MLRLITSADSRFAAISNVVRVRVEFSKKRLNTDLPRSSGTFFTSRSAIDTNGTAVSRMRDDDLGGQALERQQMGELAVGVELRVTHRPTSVASTSLPSAARDSTIERLRATASRAPAYVASIGSSRPPRSTSTASSIARRPAEVEQLVDRGANAAARVEHVVDQHDRRALDLERQLGALDLRLQALAAEIVAIERDVDEADRVVARRSSLREPLGDPGAARIDADEPRVEGDRAAHALGERGERLLGVRQARLPSSRESSSNHACRISCAATRRAPPRARRAHARGSERASASCVV